MGRLAQWLGLGDAKTTSQDESKTVTMEQLQMLAEAGWGPYSTVSGQPVSIETALGITDVLACVRVIAEGVGQVPLRVMRDRPDGGKDPALDVPEYDVFHRWPNEWQTSLEFRETLTMHTALTGNGFAFKTFAGEGRKRRLLEMIPIMPGFVSIERRRNLETLYHVSDMDGGFIGTFTADQIFHLRGPSWDSIAGLDIVRKAREAIGLTMAIETSQAKQYVNGIRTPGFVSVEGKQTPDTMKRMVELFKNANAGVENHYKTPFLDNNAKWQSMGLSNADAQTLESRKLQTESICRAFRVFPQMIGHSDKTATYASAEQFFLAHVVHTLLPWFSRWEQALDRDFFKRQKGLYSHFTVNGLMRGDQKARAEFYKAGITDGWLMRNEARRYEDLNPIPGLDRPLVQQNMAYADGSPVVKITSDSETGADNDGN